MKRKCKCGAQRVLIQPAWFNKFRVPTWVCIAKSCPFPRSPERAMSAKEMLHKLLEGFFYKEGDTFHYMFKEDTGIGDMNKELQRNLSKFCKENDIHQ